jgi:hypothetical protein
MTIKTPISPISVRPTAVKRVRAENGVIIAHPGIRSRALRSIVQTTLSSIAVYRAEACFWWWAIRALHRHASRVNLRVRQLFSARDCMLDPVRREVRVPSDAAALAQAEAVGKAGAPDSRRASNHLVDIHHVVRGAPADMSAALSANEGQSAPCAGVT